MVTGEPIPVEKTVDSKVTGGTVNGTGSFVMTAERVGADTLLSQIVRMVSEAQRSRAPIQRLADTVSGWFVPIVIVVAVVTFGIWAAYGPEPRFAHAIVNAVAGLIIACPCALGLATPMSIMVGTGRGAELGILLRNAEALELFAEKAAARLKAIKAPALIVYSPTDALFPAESVMRTADAIKANGAPVKLVALDGKRGHLDGVLGIKQAEKEISAFLAK